MRCPGCGARGYSRKAKAPEWRCSGFGHERGGKPEPQIRRGVVLTAVQQRGISSSTLLLFAAIVFMVRAVMLMLGPLLVALADDFGTSIAVAGQLAAATFVTWGITAPLVGPISDTYGRKPVLLIGVLLMALGVLGSGAAWSYGSLLATAAHHWHRIRNASPDHHGGTGRQLTA